MLTIHRRSPTTSPRSRTFRRIQIIWRCLPLPTCISQLHASFADFGFERAVFSTFVKFDVIRRSINSWLEIFDLAA